MDVTLAKDSATQREPRSPRLGAYTDFRVYLRDYYDFRRGESSSSRRPYSYATFAAAADIKSPNYLKLIIDGQRNLSPEMSKKFARAMALDKEEGEEFAALVEYGQASEPLERNRRLKVLADLRIAQQLRRGEINVEMWEKVPGWVTWVLHALTDQAGVEFDPDKLCERMRGKARPEEIRRSLERLFNSGELVRDQHSGHVQKGRELISGSETIPVELVRKLQAELIYLGLESLFHDSPQDREFGAQTMALTEDEFEILKFELRQFRKHWAKDVSVARKTTKGERVFQLNIQLFAVTNKANQESDR